MNQKRRAEFLHRWVNDRETLYEPQEEPPSRPRRFDFKRDAKPFEDYRNDRRGEPNLILEGRIRVTKIGRWHWVSTGPKNSDGFWCGFGEQWNRFSKTWSEPRWFVCDDFECEGNTVSQI